MFLIGKKTEIMTELYIRDKKGTLTEEYILEISKKSPLVVVRYLIDKTEYQELCLELIKKDYDLLDDRNLLDKIFNNINTINFVLENLEEILSSLNNVAIA